MKRTDDGLTDDIVRLQLNITARALRRNEEEHTMLKQLESGLEGLHRLYEAQIAPPEFAAEQRRRRAQASVDSGVRS